MAKSKTPIKSLGTYMSVDRNEAVKHLWRVIKRITLPASKKGEEMTTLDWAEVTAREIVIPWENFNINAWGEDMGSSARTHLLKLFSQSLREARANAIEECTKLAWNDSDFFEADKSRDYREGSFITARRIARDLRALVGEDSK